MQLINHASEIISPPITNIIYSYGEWQPSYDTMKNVKFVEGIVTLPHCEENTLFIIDDQMADAGKTVADLFVKGSHHKNISVVFIVQNLFHHNREMRTITLNAHYIVLFKSPRDKSAVNALASQMYPGKASFFKQVFADATKEPHSYLLIDLKQSTPDYLRLRANMFPGESHFVYVDKKECVSDFSFI